MNAYQEITKLVGFSNHPDAENENYAFNEISNLKNLSLHVKQDGL